MNIFQLECFLAVANTLSFARAAERLNVSQPTITHQIKTLEEELDTKLFRRSTRLVEITHEGESFISDARSMVTIAAQAKMRFGSSEKKAIETISIGCSSYPELALLSDTLNNMRNEIPNLHPNLFVFPHEQLFHYLNLERLDVVFDIYDSSETKEDVKYTELSRSEVVCICRSDHRLAECGKIDAKDLADETLIFCNPITLAPEIAKLQYRLAEGREPAQVHFCTSPEAAYVLAISGYGVAILPELLFPEGGNAVKIRLDDTPTLSCGLFYRPKTGDSLIRQFIQSAKTQFSEKNEANA